MAFGKKKIRHIEIRCPHCGLYIGTITDLVNDIEAMEGKCAACGYWYYFGKHRPSLGISLPGEVETTEPDEAS